MDNTNTQNSLAKAPRKIYLDIARTIAIISISLNHAVNRSFPNYAGQQADFNDCSLIISIIKGVTTVFSRIGVPLFLMITGVLILNKNFEDGNDIKKFYKNNYLAKISRLDKLRFNEVIIIVILTAYSTALRRIFHSTP